MDRDGDPPLLRQRYLHRRRPPPGLALIVDGSGNLYGTTSEGYINSGAVFELLPNAATAKWTEKALHRFCTDGGTCPTGANPAATLIVDGSGNIYGTTGGGGSHGWGTVFELENN